MNALGTPPLEGRPCARFPRSARLLLSRDFKTVFDHGTHVVGKLMVMWVGKGTPPGLRLGVVASKRTFRRAVDRNRAKRLLREAFRLNRACISGSGDLVIIARHRILRAERRAVEREFMWLLRKAGLMDAAGSAPGPDQSEARR
ncbi:MAG: ribonuclease P protein component [Verrucomicrobia bacterium]|nr:ribonuclease P protein component [Verrucomicrobiota bacterium]